MEGNHPHWELAGVRNKLLSLLLSWDLRHPGDAAACFRRAASAPRWKYTVARSAR